MAKTIQADTPVLSVVAGVIVKEGKLLLARRSGGDMHGYWELPGGKVEKGEIPTQSLKREMKEELGVEVEVGEMVGRSEHEIPGKKIRLAAYRVFPRSTDFVLSAHSEVKWVEPRHWDGYEWAPADLPLLDCLRQIIRKEI